MRLVWTKDCPKNRTFLKQNICSKPNIQHSFESVKRKSKICLNFLICPLGGHLPTLSGLRPSPPDRGRRPLKGKAKDMRPQSLPLQGKVASPKAMTDEVLHIIYRRRRGKKVPFVRVFFRPVLLFLGNRGIIPCLIRKTQI